MRISETGNSLPASGPVEPVTAGERGFTLTEMMVVLVIIGLLASAVVFNLPDPNGRLVDVGERFAARALAAQETAIVDQRDIALWVSPTGYGFERYESGDWIPLGAPPFEDQQWGEGVAASAMPMEVERARIVFDSTGLNDPLDVTIARGDESISVVIGADGHIELEVPS